MIPIFAGKVEKAKIIFDAPVRFENYLFPLNGQKVEVTVRKQKSQRSLNQNSYYWGVVLDILSKHTGYEPDEMHEICKFQFLKTGGKGKFEYVKSTTKMNTTEFEEYLDKIKRWSADILNCYIPDPNQVAA